MGDFNLFFILKLFRNKTENIASLLIKSNPALTFKILFCKLNVYRRLFLVSVLLLFFSTHSFANANFGIINAIKNQTKDLTAKKEAGTINRIVAKDNAYYLSSATMQYFVKQDGSNLIFSDTATEFKSLKSGSILVGSFSFSSAAPGAGSGNSSSFSVGDNGEGCLLKVVSIAHTGNQYIVETATATLDEAFSFTNIQLNTQLTTADLDPNAQHALRKGVSFYTVSEKEFKWVLNGANFTCLTGSVDISGDIAVMVSLDHVLLMDNGLKEFKMILTVKDTCNYVVTTSLSGSISQEFPLDELLFKRTFWTKIKTLITDIADIPIQYKPKLSIIVGVQSSFGMSSTVTKTQTATIIGGIWWKDGHFQNPSTIYDQHFSGSLPVINMFGSIKAYVGPKFEIKIHGLLTPYVKVDGFLQLTSTFDKYWNLIGGLEGTAGVEIGPPGIFDKNFSFTFTPYSFEIIAGGHRPVLIDKGISPAQGVSGSAFTYSVNYSDGDNNAPQSGYPRVHIYKSGAEISGSPFTMSYTPGNYKTGVTCSFSKTLALTGSDYSYTYDATDEVGDIAPSISSNGPTVNSTGGGSYVYKGQWGGYGGGYGLFDNPAGIAIGYNGNIYVADFSNSIIQKFTSEGLFITQWGSYGSGYGQFDYPNGLAVDSSGNVYVAESHNNRIQKFDANGNLIGLWGSYGSSYGQFDYPLGVAVSGSGYVYVADSSNCRIQKFTSAGTFVTAWGGYGTGVGQFSTPERIAVNSSGYVYVSDLDNCCIQKFTSSGGFVRTWGSYGSGNGQFISPCGIAIDSSGDVYVVDRGNNRVQKFTSDGTFITSWGSSGYGDGQLYLPLEIAVDSSTGNVYVSDSGNDRIQIFNKN